MKKVWAILLVLVLCLSLCACGGNADGDNSGPTKPTQIEGNKLTADNVVGTGWQCTYHTDDDNKIYTRFMLAEDGTYKQLIAINELFDRYENGTYEVKGGKLYLYLNGDTNSSTVYEYKNKNLVNDGHEFTTYVE